jgi:DNA repair ATPase RecN
MSSETKDIVLVEEAFEKASQNLDELAREVRSLHDDILKALGELQTGFDTPAGRKFIESSKNGLLEQLKKQETAVSNYSSKLSAARQKYATVFSDYNELNKTLSSYSTK